MVKPLKQLTTLSSSSLVYEVWNLAASSGLLDAFSRRWEIFSAISSLLGSGKSITGTDFSKSVGSSNVGERIIIALFSVENSKHKFFNWRTTLISTCPR